MASGRTIANTDLSEVSVLLAVTPATATCMMPLAYTSTFSHVLPRPFTDKVPSWGCCCRWVSRWRYRGRSPAPWPSPADC